MKKFLLAFVLGAMLSGGFTYMTVKEEDIREVILRIQKENKLTGSDLSVGQRLVIPVRKTVADVIAEQNERNAGRAQLAAK